MFITQKRPLPNSRLRAPAMPATIVLKNGKDHSLRRRHPWVFSGAIARVQGEPTEGEAVRVETQAGELLGVATTPAAVPLRCACSILGLRPNSLPPIFG